jgi:hypothetical protein
MLSGNSGGELKRSERGEAWRQATVHRALVHLFHHLPRRMLLDGDEDVIQVLP